jgi:RNA polymerase sigma-70 factor (ECF subfamily)
MKPENTEILSAAFTEMRAALFTFFRGRVSDDAVAEDLVSETFLRLSRTLVNGGEPAHLRGYVFKTANNLIIDHWRRRATRKEQGTSGVELQELADPNPRDEDEEVRAALAKCLRGMMGALPEKTRDALIAHDLDGVPIQSLATKNEMSASGMKSRIQRGRGRLRDAFEACCNVEIDGFGRAMDFSQKEGACAKC